jgi:hypothetical protein
LASLPRMTAGIFITVVSPEDCSFKSHHRTYQAGRQAKSHWWPILSISFLMASRSRPGKGRDRNRLILRSRRKNASRKALSICSMVPCAAAGSGTPQWAVSGWPGQSGQLSFAALSQM